MSPRSPVYRPDRLALPPTPAPRQPRQKPEKPPKNGSYYVVLVAGGPHDVFLDVREYLARHRGMFAKYHRDWEKRRLFSLPIPVDVDLVLILTDMIGHPMEWATRDQATAAGVMWSRAQRKKAALSAALSKMHFQAYTSLPEVMIAAFVEGKEGAPDDNAVTDPSPFRLLPPGQTTITTTSRVVELGPTPLPPPPPPTTPEPAHSIVDTPLVVVAAPVVEKTAPSDKLVLAANETFRIAAAEGWSVLITPHGYEFNRGGIKK